MKQQSPRTVALFKRILLAAALFSAPLFASHATLQAQAIQVEVGSDDVDYYTDVPFVNGSSDGYAQFIYKSSLFSTYGSISDIAFYCVDIEGGMDPESVTIYMGVTNSVYDGNGDDWIPASALTEVYSGTLTQPSATGWFNITLDTPFDYDGSGHLVVSILRTGGTESWSQTYYLAEDAAGDYVSMISYYATDHPDATADDAQGYFPYTRFTLIPSSTCYAPTALSLSSITTNSAVASWSAPTDGTAPVAYEVSCMTGTSAPVKTVVTTTSAPLSGLLPASYYTLSVRSICGVGDTSHAATLPFATLCTEYTLPFADRLNEAPSYSAFDVANRLPICWEFPGLATANDAYPQAYVDMTKNLVLATTSAAPAVAVMPAIAGNLDSTMLSFTVALHPSVTLEYGFVTDADDSSSFVPMGSVVNGSSYSFDLSEAIELIPLGSRLAFRATTVDAVRRTALLSAISLVDAPTCKTPIKLAIDTLNLTQNSFRITWGGTMNDGDIYRFRYTIPGSNDTTTVTDITARNYTVSGLPGVGQPYAVLIDKTCANNQTSGVARLVNGVNTKGMVHVYVAPGQEHMGYVTGDSIGYVALTGAFHAVAKPHYRFVRWDDNSTANPQYFYYRGRTNVETHYAYFEPEQYTVTVQSSNDLFGTVAVSTPDPGNHYDYLTDLYLTATPVAGHTFVGWSDGSTEQTNHHIRVTGNAEITAYFSDGTASVVATLNDTSLADIVTVPADGIAPSGDPVTVSVTLRDPEHYQFAFEPAAATTQSGATYTATFEAISGGTMVLGKVTPKEYKIREVTVYPSDGSLGTVGGVRKNEYYPYGTVLNIFAEPKGLARFAAWSGALDGTATPTTLLIDGPKNITARFERDSITVRVVTNHSERGVVSIGIAGSGITEQRVAVGDQVNLVAVPNNNYVFFAWDNATSSATQTLTAYGADGAVVTYTAFFYPVQFTINASVPASQAAWGTATGGARYGYNVQANLYATANEHYHFDHWSLMGTNVSTSTHYRPLVLTDADYEAIFAPDPVIVTCSADPLKGSISYSDDTVYGGTLTVTVDTMPGWTFLRCESANGTLYPQSVGNRIFEISNLVGDTSIVAIFDQTEYRITITAVNGSINTVNGTDVSAVGSYDVATHHYGDVLNVTAILDSDPAHTEYVCSWNDPNGTTGTTLSYTVTGPADLVANFQDPANKVVTALSNNNAWGSASADAPSYVTGDKAVVTATANEHYRFDHWSCPGITGIDSTLNPLVITTNSSHTVTAVFAPQNYTLTTAVNDPDKGHVTAGGSYPYGTQVTVTATPFAGQHVESWTGATGTTDEVIVTVNSDMTVTANFATSDMLFTVNGTNAQVNVDGGTYYTSQNYSRPYGSTMTLSAAPNTHYQFSHWSDGNAQNPRTVTVDNTTIYNAIAVAREYTIIAEPNDDFLGDVTGGARGTYGSGNALLHAYPAPNCHFVSWSGATTSTEEEISVAFDANKTYIANFVRDSFDVTIVNPDPKYGTAEVVNPSVNDRYVYGAMVQLRATPNLGVRFLRWSDGNTDEYRYLEVKASANLSAIFDSVEYTVSTYVNSNALGSVSVVPQRTVYRYGDTIHVSYALSSPDTVNFICWEDGTQEAVREIVIHDTLHLCAYFAEGDRYSLVGMSNNDLWGTVTGTAYNAPAGSSHTLTAIPSSHHVFLGWSDSMDASFNPRTVVLDQGHAIVVTAYFVPDTHSVAFATPIVGGSLLGDGSYAHGTSVLMVATPDDHYHFVEWNDHITLNPRTVIVEGDSLYGVTFRKDTVKINVVAPNCSAISGNGTYDYGDIVNLSVTPAANYRFVNWTLNGAVVGTDPVLPAFSAIENATYIANVVLDTVALTLAVDHPEWGRVDGAVLGRTVFDYGTSVALTATPNSHYVFAGWSNGVTTNTLTLDMTRDTNVTALFLQKEYTVTVASLDPAKGSVNSADFAGNVYHYGDLVTFVATPTLGNTFSGWSNASIDNPMSLVVNGNMNITASFAPAFHTLSLSANNSTMGSVLVTPAQTSYYHGQPVNVTARVSDKSLYKFISWNDGVTDSTRTVVMDSNVTLIAIFGDAALMNLTAISNDTAMGTVTPVSASVNYGASVALTATAKPHYHFTGWSDDATLATASRSVVVVSDTLVEALFAVDTHTMTLNVAGNGTTEGAGTYDWNSRVTVFARAAENHHFVEWSDHSSVNPRVINLGGDSILTAIFVPDTMTVSASAVNGTVAGFGRFGYNDTVTLIAQSSDADSYHFVGWSKNGQAVAGTSDTLGFRATESAYYVARYDINTYALTADVNDPAMGSITGTANGLYEHGTPVSVRAYPAAHHHFLHWSGDFTDNAAVKAFNLDSNVTVTAHFAIDSFLVAYASSDTTIGSVIATVDSGSYPYGTQWTLTAQPKPGFRFAGWSDGNDQLVRNLTVTADVNLMADFDTIDYNVVIASNDPLKGTVTGTQSIYRYGDVLNLEAVPSDTNRFRFDFWSDADVNASRTIVVTGDFSLIAFFSDVTPFTLNVLSNDTLMGTVTGSGNFFAHDSADLVATPALHHHLVRWSDLDDNTLVRRIEVTGDSTVTALFAIDTVSLTLAASSYGILSGAGQYGYGSQVSVSATDTLQHYHFDHWSTSTGDTLSTDNPWTLTLTSDTALQAAFALNSYLVTTEVTNGTVVGAGSYPALTDTVLVAAADDHYLFMGWSKDDSDAIISTNDTLRISVVADVTYKAVIVPETYNYNYSANNASIGYVMSNITPGAYDYNTAVTLTAQAYPHAHFVNWSNGETSATLTFNLDADTNLVANFEADEFTLTVASADTNMGTVTGSGTYHYHDLATISATAAYGYHFVNWSDGVTDATRDIYVERDSNLTANFAINRYQVTALVSNSLMGTVTGSGWYNHGDIVYIDASPNEHFDFVGFNGRHDADTHAAFIVTSDTTVVAYFKHHYMKMYLSAEHGTFSVTVDGERKSTNLMPILAIYNDTVDLVAVPDEHYHLDHWDEYRVNYTVNYHDSIVFDTLTRYVMENGNLIEYHDSVIQHTVRVSEVHSDTVYVDTYFDTDLSFRITYDRYLEAVFVPNRYLVTLQGENVTVSGASVYTYGTPVTVTATPAYGYTFVGWVDDNGDTVSHDASYTFTIEDNVTLTAVVAKNVGIESLESTSVNIYSTGNTIVVTGAEHRQVRLFDAVGRQVCATVATSDRHSIAVNAAGIYMVQVDGAPVKRVSVVR